MPPPRYALRSASSQNIGLTPTSLEKSPAKSELPKPSMAPTDVSGEFLMELGVNLSTLSEENKILVHVLMGGIKKLLDRQFEAERQAFELKVEGLQNQIAALQDRNDDLENYGRRNTIIISGSALPQVLRDENCIDLATDVVKNRLSIRDFERTDIDVAHRLGKPRPGSSDRRNIIVKLVRRENKRKIFLACRVNKPQNLYINESVSKTRSTILYVLRKASKDFPTKFSSCTTEDGNIRVRLPSPEDPTKFTRETVNTRGALDVLLRTRINADSSKYEPRWTT